MQSAAATVDEYMNEVPADRLPALSEIRALCRRELKGYSELMRYGMPCYEKNGIVEVSFASQKNNLALYILKKDVLDRFRAELKDASVGKGCIRYAKPDKINFVLVRKLLTGTFESTTDICG
jgi:uncharacterized protein YdhG (YjbR/CyaY superfamily)